MIYIIVNAGSECFRIHASPSPEEGVYNFLFLPWGESRSTYLNDSVRLGIGPDNKYLLINDNKKYRKYFKCY